MKGSPKGKGWGKMNNGNGQNWPTSKNTPWKGPNRLMSQMDKSPEDGACSGLSLVQVAATTCHTPLARGRVHEGRPRRQGLGQGLGCTDLRLERA